MNEIDNFKAVSSILEFDEGSSDNYYFLEILQRRKDFPEGADCQPQTTLYSYFISSKEKLERIEPEVKMLCRMLNARAYLNPNKKSKKKTCMLLMKDCLNMIENDSFSKLPSKMTSAAGQCTGEKDKKKFLVDIDTKDATVLVTVLSIIETVDPENVHCTIPTVNGYHVIATPFDVQKFNDLGGRFLKNVEIKHNSPVLLYFAGGQDAAK